MDDLKKLLQAIQSELKDIKTNMATQQMLIKAEQRTKEAIHNVYETAVTIEDKAEVGDVLVKSFVDALEEKTTKRFDMIENQLKIITSSLDDIRKLFEYSLRKDQQFEREITELKRKLG